MNPSPVVLITGASSGIGLSAAQLFSEKGWIVYGAARRLERMKSLESKGVRILPLDVTDDQSMQDCVQSVIQQAGRIDCLINNAGYGFFGAVENVPIEDARHQLEVNLVGLARMVQLVLPYMRQQKCGRIINVSSIAGRFSMPFGAWYHATKFAVEGWSESLRAEVKPFGIKVALIEPGPIKTDWGIIAADHLAAVSKGGAYEERAFSIANLMRLGYSRNYLSTPDVIAKAMYHAASSRCPKLRYVKGSFAKLGVFLHGILGSRLFARLLDRAFRIAPKLVK